MATLPCDNGAGSLNNPNGSNTQIGTNNPALAPYVAPAIQTGDWQISGLALDTCAAGDQLRQETYVAEQLNIAGAPINIFKLLGVHEQGIGSILSQGTLISSQAYPGYPLSGLNVAGSSWRSIQLGSATVATSYVGIDFGVKQIFNGQSEYDPARPKWTKVGSINITQANTPNEYARQVRVEMTTGDCSISLPIFTGTGNGAMSVTSTGINASQGLVMAMATSATTFSVTANTTTGPLNLGTATVGAPFLSTFANFIINAGSNAFVAGDMFTFQLSYNWQRVGLFNLIQSPLPQTLNFKTIIALKAVRIVPTMFTGNGSWEVDALDMLDYAPSDVNDIQDLFFNENRDRDYAIEPILMKAQYNPADSMSDLSRFGLSILDSYAFTISFATMVSMLNRPIVVGDIIEVTPELQWDQNLKPVRKFLEVTDTGWSTAGFSTFWRPTVFRFSASPATPSQETRDIFGTIDTQKYLIADSVLDNGIGAQIDTTPLTNMEEIMREAADMVPKTGSDDNREIAGIPLPVVLPPANAKGQPSGVGLTQNVPNIYIEDGLPKDGSAFTEGYKLPDATTAADGEYFRLNYPDNLKIPPRLHRFSTVKNKWIYLETDRRGDYTSHKPSVRSILQSSTHQPLGKKV